ncbi:MAG TPA: hypothetical protein VGP72_02835 [Planctomycetota bacterium]|jgi:hypothetical protein
MADESRDSRKAGGAAAQEAAKRSARFTELLNAPPNRKTPLGTDTAWALKLKDATCAAVRELHVQVLSAKPICTFVAHEDEDMLFELETDRGSVQAVRSRDGKYTFEWK